MNDDELPDGINTSFRLNLILTQDMKNQVRERIKYAATYNGVSDFLGCAIRDYIPKFTKSAHTFLDLIKDENKDPKDAERAFRQGMLKLGESLYSDCREKYPGPLTAQISLRMATPFYASMREATSHLGLGNQEFARVALQDYLVKTSKLDLDVYSLNVELDSMLRDYTNCDMSMLVPEPFDILLDSMKNHDD
ncbi:MAG: hypothetical protein IKR86_08945 [Candidatus Methanomethylophilaceae archaeon]|nr:hypothetical protein [Candidatus Methanomethylophilaceae archaeon]